MEKCEHQAVMVQYYRERLVVGANNEVKGFALGVYQAQKAKFHVQWWPTDWLAENQETSVIRVITDEVDDDIAQAWLSFLVCTRG
ncbi:hypothetical protein RP20_CCG001230 [Aedes albopictus]|nr:hypothetical protein RP20_CCG001230 [Aedes albopictus]